MLKVAALYHFTAIADLESLRDDLLSSCTNLDLRGTLLLAVEGINGTIAGEDEAIDSIVAHIRALPGFAEIDVKYSGAEEMPFDRMKVRLKREIVTMGVAGIDPVTQAGTRVAPQDWNAMISDPDTIVIDTRNDYEVAIGSFAGAIDPETPTFRDFPAWFDAQAQAWEGRQPRIAMFCTGGIRCEKATAYVKAQGYDDVYHLGGGILRYLEEVPAEESLWQGECFVFDQRVALKHGLEQGEHLLCQRCGFPVPKSAFEQHEATCEGTDGWHDAKRA